MGFLEDAWKDIAEQYTSRNSAYEDRLQTQSTKDSLASETSTFDDKFAVDMLQNLYNDPITGESVQITLADQIAMDDIKNNPELFEKYKDHIMMKRPNLPEQKIFVDYLRSITSIKELSEKTDIKNTAREI